MSYGALYAYCQTLRPPVDVNAIADHAATLAKLPRRPQLFRSGTMKSGALRGAFVKPGQTEHYLAKHCNGNPIVVIARDLNYCWSRFVYVKEVMHVFDESLTTVGTSVEFAALVMGMTSPTPGERPASVNSEILAYWMALGCCCPEDVRQDLQRRFQSGELSERDIAEQLKIPEHTISRLFQPNYKAIMVSLTETP
jgi:hypothetical protein